MPCAGITLVRGDLRGIAQAIHLNRATMWNIRENLFFAFLYSALGIPVAAESRSLFSLYAMSFCSEGHKNVPIRSPVT